MVGNQGHALAGCGIGLNLPQILARAARQSISIRQFRAFVVCVNIIRAAAYLMAPKVSSQIGIHPKSAFLFASPIIFT
jgi:uncharacterized membrane protein YjfL (UPF0719 family)